MWTVHTRANGTNYYHHVADQQTAISYHAQMLLAGHHSTIEPPTAGVR